MAVREPVLAAAFPEGFAESGGRESRMPRQLDHKPGEVTLADGVQRGLQPLPEPGHLDRRRVIASRVNHLCPLADHIRARIAGTDPAAQRLPERTGRIRAQPVVKTFDLHVPPVGVPPVVKPVVIVVGGTAAVPPLAERVGQPGMPFPPLLRCAAPVQLDHLGANHIVEFVPPSMVGEVQPTLKPPEELGAAARRTILTDDHFKNVQVDAARERG